MKDFYLFLSSKDSKHLFPSNAPNTFSVKLPHPITLPGKWSCALVQCSLSSRPSNTLFLETDFTDHVTVGGKLVAVLGEIANKNQQYQHLKYIRVRRSTLEVVCVKVINRLGNTTDAGKGETSCILHFRPE